MALTELASHVTRRMVEAHLIGRPTGLLSESAENIRLFEDLTNGITSEVVPLVGSDPEEGPKRNLAVWAISIGVAGMVENALFPEQQGPGDDGRAEILLAQYRALLKQIRETYPPGDDDEGAESLIGYSQGEFPPPVSYPDPARGYHLGLDY